MYGLFFFVLVIHTITRHYFPSLTVPHLLREIMLRRGWISKREKQNKLIYAHQEKMEPRVSHLGNLWHRRTYMTREYITAEFEGKRLSCPASFNLICPISWPHNAESVRKVLYYVKELSDDFMYMLGKESWDRARACLSCIVIYNNILINFIVFIRPSVNQESGMMFVVLNVLWIPLRLCILCWVQANHPTIKCIQGALQVLSICMQFYDVRLVHL